MNVVVPIGGRWILVWSVESFYCSTSGISVETSQTSVGCHTNTLRSHHIRYGPTTVIHSERLLYCTLLGTVSNSSGSRMISRVHAPPTRLPETNLSGMLHLCQNGTRFIPFRRPPTRYCKEWTSTQISPTYLLYYVASKPGTVHMHASRPALNKIQNLITQFSRLFSSP